MSESSGLETRDFVLPFSVLSANRKEPFPLDLEVATVFALSELNRTKGGGYILKQSEEKMAFMAKIGYPLWYFPSGERALIFDGLNMGSYGLQYVSIPDVKTFLDELKQSSKNIETYEAFLSNYLRYFEAPTNPKDLLVRGLMGNPEFLSEFQSFRREASEMVEKPTNMALLNSVLDEPAMRSGVIDLERLQSSFKEENISLRRSIRLINKITHHYIREIRIKAIADREEYDAKIKNQEEVIAPKIAAIREEHDNQTISMTNSVNKQILPVQREKMKLEKDKDQTISRIEKFKLEAKSREKEGDSVGEKRWKEKSNEVKKELSEIEEQLKRNEKMLKNIEEQKSLELVRLHSDLETSVKGARQPLLELEASRDAKSLIHKQEIEKLENQTKLISDQVGEIAKLRATDLAKYEQVSLKGELGSVIGLFYVPFYVASYRMAMKTRYLILPPSAANPIGFSTKLKGAFGRTKIKGLLAPRFGSLTLLMDNIQVLIQQNRAFETELADKGERNDLSQDNSVLEKIRSGLGYLRNEGWLSEKELEELKLRTV
jgi:hypothetical protein